METLVAGRTMRGQVTAAEDCIKALKLQLADARLTIKKLAGESPRTEADLCAEIVAGEESLDAEKAHV